LKWAWARLLACATGQRSGTVVLLETLAQAHRFVDGVAELSIELSCGLIRAPDLEIYLRAAEIAKSPLGLVHEQASESLTPMIGADREVVDPSAVALVANHDGPDQLVALFDHEKVVRVSGQLAVDIPVGVVPRSREPADRPERHEAPRGRPARYDRSTGSTGTVYQSSEGRFDDQEAPGTRATADPGPILKP